MERVHSFEKQCNARELKEKVAAWEYKNDLKRKLPLRSSQPKFSLFSYLFCLTFFSHSTSLCCSLSVSSDLLDYFEV